ncbi:PROTEIN MIS12-like protein [Salix viminalis]|uniref:PROTEIN MIS12-like protein n=1 Tax=Salix viminalis TaxID=40686 RepID=A0A6N2LIW9_SALVM|nr:PROTEIN MIS12-like protein [Salix viminalis]
MEGSESEAVFESLNLSPRLFINETLNTVDDLLDDAFHFYNQEASNLFKTDGTDRSRFLSEGIAYIRNMIQSDLDTRLGMWEKYCLHHVFAVPKGFSLPQTKESPTETFTCQDLLFDPDLDAQLDILRNKLTMVGKESAGLNHELQALERQSASSDHCSELVSQALQLYGQPSMQDMFQDMLSTMSELHEKMEKLRTRKVENLECIRAKRIKDPNRDLLASNYRKGLPNATVEDIQEFMADLKRM